MSNEAKHTPTPWFATPTSGLYGHISAADTDIEDCGGGIATTWGGHGSDAKADAALIVHAVNSYEATQRLLVDVEEAMRDCKTFHDRDEGCNGFTAAYEILRHQIDTALAAIAEHRKANQ